MIDEYALSILLVNESTDENFILLSDTVFKIIYYGSLKLLRIRDRDVTEVCVHEV